MISLPLSPAADDIRDDPAWQRVESQDSPEDSSMTGVLLIAGVAMAFILLVAGFLHHRGIVRMRTRMAKVETEMGILPPEEDQTALPLAVLAATRKLKSSVRRLSVSMSSNSIRRRSSVDFKLSFVSVGRRSSVDAPDANRPSCGVPRPTITIPTRPCVETPGRMTSRGNTPSSSRDKLSTPDKISTAGRQARGTRIDEDTVRITFDIFDRDQLNGIFTAELSNALRHLGLASRTEHAKKILADYETKTTNGKMTYHDFRALVDELQSFKLPLASRLPPPHPGVVLSLEQVLQSSAQTLASNGDDAEKLFARTCEAGGTETRSCRAANAPHRQRRLLTWKELCPPAKADSHITDHVAMLMERVDEPTIVEAFMRMDADGNGKIELRELHAILAELDGSITEADAEAVMIACDHSGDGKVSLIELLKAKTQEKRYKTQDIATLSVVKDVALAMHEGINEAVELVVEEVKKEVADQLPPAPPLPPPLRESRRTSESWEVAPHNEFQLRNSVVRENATLMVAHVNGVALAMHESINEAMRLVVEEEKKEVADPLPPAPTLPPPRESRRKSRRTSGSWEVAQRNDSQLRNSVIRAKRDPDQKSHDQIVYHL
jgi:Ca2+-binding EF-hand superfamily protein